MRHTTNNHETANNNLAMCVWGNQAPTDESCKALPLRPHIHKNNTKIPDNWHVISLVPAWNNSRITNKIVEQKMTMTMTSRARATQTEARLRAPPQCSAARAAAPGRRAARAGSPSRGARPRARAAVASGAWPSIILERKKKRSLVCARGKLTKKKKKKKKIEGEIQPKN
jgi:hypothetical protein